MGIEDRRVGSVADSAIGSTTVTLTAPTVAQITALTRIECGIVDTIDAPRSGSSVDLSGLCSRESVMVAGPVTNEDVTGTLWREFDGTDAYWVAFDDSADPAVTQTLAICRAGFSGVSGVPAIGDEVDLYRVQVNSRSPVGPVRDGGQRFEVSLSVISYNPDVTIVA